MSPVVRRFSLWSLTALAVAAAGHLPAQQPKKLSATALRTLDTQADKAKGEYLKSLTDLAKSYEDAGQTDKSREMLQAILTVNPDDAGVKKKLKEIDEAIFQKNDFELKLDTSRPWQNAGIQLTKDQTIRITAEGDYKVYVSETLGPEGYPNDDPTKDLVSGIPMGALMAAMAPPGAGASGGGNRGQRNNNEEVKPFSVGKSLEYTPKADGPIFFKVNVPVGAKATGILRITVRGHFKAFPGARG